MSKCGDCIHFPVCEYHPEPEETFAEVGGCSTFKSKDTFVEVVHGKWQEDTAYDTIACTECGHMWNTIDNCTETFNYCPNCGAKMDGGNEDGG